MNLWELLKQSYKEWSADKATRLAAATSYYVLFSLAPLLVIAIAIFGFIVGSQQQVQASIHNQISSMISPGAADTVGTMIQNTRQNGSGGTIATIISLLLLLFGATGAFSALQDALNTIWEVKPGPNQGIGGMIKDRLASFGLVLVIGFLLLVSLVISAVLSALGAFFQNLLPGRSDLVYQIINIVISLGVITLLFAAIFKILPDVYIRWRDVWVGAFVTAILFTIGKTLIGLYLGHSSATSVYGAAGSLAVILIWVYYSAVILFFGAEFTQVYASSQGTEIKPARGAVFMTDEDRAHLGMVRESKRRRTSSPGSGIPAVVPVTGQSSQVQQNQSGSQITLPAYRRYPQKIEFGRPPMPLPVKIFTSVISALVGVLGVSGLVMSVRSNPSRKKLELENQRLKQEADQMREMAQRMQHEAGLLQTTASLMGSFGENLENQGERIEGAVEKIQKQTKKGVG